MTDCPRARSFLPPRGLKPCERANERRWRLLSGRIAS
jgi:hypothetical protein